MHEMKDLGQFVLVGNMFSIWMHNKNISPLELNISQLHAHAVFNLNGAKRECEELDVFQSPNSLAFQISDHSSSDYLWA